MTEQNDSLLLTTDLFCIKYEQMFIIQSFPLIVHVVRTLIYNISKAALHISIKLLKDCVSLPVTESRSSLEVVALKKIKCPLRGTGCRNTLSLSSSSTGTPVCTDPTALKRMLFIETSTTQASRTPESSWDVFTWRFVRRSQNKPTRCLKDIDLVSGLCDVTNICHIFVSTVTSASD